MFPFAFSAISNGTRAARAILHQIRVALGLRCVRVPATVGYRSFLLLCLAWGQTEEGDGWIHQVKFDGYRSQTIIDDGDVRICTRRGLDWTTKYRDLVETAKGLNVQSVIVDGESSS